MTCAAGWDFVVALFGTAVGCWLAVRWAPPQAGSLAPQLVRTLLRSVWVLVVVAVGIGMLDRSPAAVTGGALVGWAVVGAWSERPRSPRRGRNG